MPHYPIGIEPLDLDVGAQRAKPTSQPSALFFKLPLVLYWEVRDYAVKRFAHSSRSALSLSMNSSRAARSSEACIHCIEAVHRSKTGRAAREFVFTFPRKYSQPRKYFACQGVRKLRYTSTKMSRGATVTLPHRSSSMRCAATRGFRHSGQGQDQKVAPTGADGCQLE